MEHLTNEQVQALRAAAEKATPGEWREGVDGNQRLYGPDGRSLDSGLIASFVRRRDLSYIAAANPQTVLALLAERDALKRERDEAREALESARTSMRNARGAVESNQVEDKDVRGTLNQAIQRINSFLAARSALSDANAAEREG